MDGGMEVSVLMAQFPSKEVAQLSYDYRTLGLGYANLGSMLMVSGIPYDSEEARGIAGAFDGHHDRYRLQNMAEMASILGLSQSMRKTNSTCCAVMRNHRFGGLRCGCL